MTTSINHGAVESAITSYLESKSKTTVTREEDLTASGLLTSMVAMELVVFLESNFDIAIVGYDLKLDNFRSVAKMTDLVMRLRGEGETGHDG